MDTQVTPGVTPARIVALGLIGLVMLGLGYLGVTRDVDPMAVPAGAQAGDLITEPCTYNTEDGGYAAACGTLVVPENRAEPDSRLIVLPVTRVRATSDDPQEPVFFLTGGPGQSNMEIGFASRFVADRDFVVVGYRGIDGSVRLDCPEVSSALKRASDVLSEEFFRASSDAYRSCADRLTDGGVDLSSYGLAQQVDDLEAARVALGYDRINLLSESAGTRTAMIYAWRYPDSIRRSVMAAVNPPGNFLWYPQPTDEQIGRYAALCAEDDSCRERTGDLAATMRAISTDMPDRWLFLPINDANVRIASMYGLFEPTTAATPISAPMTLDAWLSAAEGDPSGLWFSSVLSDLLFPELLVKGQHASAAMLDAHAARDYFTNGPGDLTNVGAAATAFGWGGGQLADAWPATPDEDEYRRVRTSKVETLLVSGALDVSTPPQVATNELLPNLPNGREVVLAGFGHTNSLFMDQPQAFSRLVNTFFDSGQVDDSLYAPVDVDFTPAMTLGQIAKFTLGVMLGFAIVTVLSLAWMARHVRKRDSFGPVSGALLRSLYPVVLGLGGWFLGALIVLTTMRGVTLDNELLAVLAVCPPTAAGIYLAWVHRDWTARNTAIELAAATVGAFIGGWLGFHATAGLLTLVTTIAGAIAGANLTLIVLDMSRAHSTTAARHETETTADRRAAKPDLSSVHRS